MSENTRAHVFPGQGETPRHEERLILAAWRAAEAKDAPIDEKRFFALVDWHGIGPLLWTGAPEGFWERAAGGRLAPGLAARYRWSRARNLLLLDRLGRVRRLLTEGEIPFLLLKGAALMEDVYPDHGQRPMADLDILLPRAHWPKLRRHLVETGGYRLPAPEREAYCLQHYHTLEVAVEDGSQVTLDLHWDLEMGGRHRIEVEELWARSVAMTLDGLSYRRLDDGSRLLHLAVHFAHHYSAPRLIWVEDLRRLLAGGADVRALLAGARQWRVFQASAHALRYVAHIFPEALDAPTQAAIRPGLVRSAIFRALRGEDPLSPTLNLRPIHRRLPFSLLLLDGPGDMARFLLGHGVRKLRSEPPGAGLPGPNRRPRS